MKRSPLKKRGSKASIKRKLDAMAREIVLTRDRSKCRRCGLSAPKVQIQWAHIYSRRYLSVRWMPQNSLALCAGCHFWIHANPMDGAEFVRDTVPSHDLDTVRDRLNSNEKPDLDAIRLSLESQLASLR